MQTEPKTKEGSVVNQSNRWLLAENSVVSIGWGMNGGTEEGQFSVFC